MKIESDLTVTIKLNSVEVDRLYKDLEALFSGSVNTDSLQSLGAYNLYMSLRVAKSDGILR